MQFSIVTACYRGVRTLPRTYQSLLDLDATGIEFEWILVDDYSNDGGETEALIRTLQEKSPFPTQSAFLDRNYYGAKSAYTGARLATGKYLIILDQDDLLTTDALRIFLRLINEYENETDFAGICGRCRDMQGHTIGTPFVWNEKLANELEIRHRHRIRGELFQCTKRELIEEYFADFEPGYTNGYVWTRMARKYRYLYTNEIVRIYDTQNPQSMTHAPKLKYLDANIFQYGYYLNTNWDYLRNDPVFFARYLLQYLRLCIHNRISLREISGGLLQPMVAVALIIYPLAYLRTVVDRRKGRV